MCLGLDTMVASHLKGGKTYESGRVAVDKGVIVYSSLLDTQHGHISGVQYQGSLAEMFRCVIY